jgi:hypothetical protein
MSADWGVTLCSDAEEERSMSAGGDALLCCSCDWNWGLRSTVESEVMDCGDGTDVECSVLVTWTTDGLRWWIVILRIGWLAGVGGMRAGVKRTSMARTDVVDEAKGRGVSPTMINAGGTRMVEIRQVAKEVALAATQGGVEERTRSVRGVLVRSGMGHVRAAFDGGTTLDEAKRRNFGGRTKTTGERTRGRARRASTAAGAVRR